MKNKKYHTVGTFAKSNRKIVERDKYRLKLETIQETDYVIELITNEPGITTL
jgi:hypothetical protein